MFDPTSLTSPDPFPSPAEGRWQILAAVADLMFTAKISAAAKHAGCPVKFLQQEEKLIAALAAQSVDIATLVIVDLNHLTLEPLRLIQRIRESPHGAAVRILAYLSHVQVDLKRAAEQAGCNLVLPRSVFSQNIQDILLGKSCHLEHLC